MKRAKPKEKSLKDETQKFPRKVTHGVTKRAGRATRRRKPHAVK